ncbi:MAG: PEGA domain-containing protein, partial [Bacteroidaceae bacterium]
MGYDTYLVETKKAGHRPSQQEVTISEESANQTISLNKPSPIYGSLDINSTPADADIYLDDKKIGTTPMFIEEQLIGS